MSTLYKHYENLEGLFPVYYRKEESFSLKMHYGVVTVIFISVLVYWLRKESCSSPTHLNPVSEGWCDWTVLPQNCFQTGR